ncbi:DUF3972 domain-containing protein [Sulfurimonas sp. HSL-1716]|uniref:DUF3972 domain-containing protein n=1 Tax=Hydrocurvibacter sulfurireducens TaxID=3131937 RepID=UPI0031F7808E
MSLNWMSIEEYADLTGLELLAIEELIARDKLVSKIENGQTYIDPSKGASEIVPSELQNVTKSNTPGMTVPAQFVEKTIGTIINLHERVLDAKDETIESIKNENMFLKEALASLQELYEEDRKTIETLTDQLKLSQQEVEFLRRKYKLMWGKVVENYSTTDKE